jgi:protein-S-isoprenylcysteine O-methyltransferase Ste14
MSERDDLTGEHKAGDAGQIVFAILFFAVWIVDTFFLHYTTFPNHFVSPWVRIPIGAFFLCLGGYCARSGLNIIFKEVRESPMVIRKGIFNVVRHPVYVSEILLYLGFFIMSLSIASLAVLLGASIFLYFISRYEEKLLLKRFGDEYRKYMNEVGMWIPRFF